MNGHRIDVEDPFVEGFKNLPYDELYNIQKEYVAKVKEVQSAYWELTVKA